MPRSHRDVAADLDALRARLAEPAPRAPAVVLVALDPLLRGSPSLDALAGGLRAALTRTCLDVPPIRIVDPTRLARTALTEAEAVLLVVGDRQPPRDPATIRQLMAYVPPERRHGVRLLGPSRGRLETRALPAPWTGVRVHPVHLHAAPDFARLTRWLLGRAVGVALGGGGARAAAHMGVLDGLQDAGVPVDALTGASAGSAMGALYATGTRGLDAVRHTATGLDRLGVTGWRAARLPAMSVLAPRRYEAFTAELVGAHRIEDLPLPFACVSTDVGSGVVRVHTDGALWRAVLASAALPGLIPPVRAADGGLLVDGGVVDNVPIGPLHAMGVGAVIAVDINPLRRWAPRARRLTRRLPRPLTAAMQGAVGQTFRGMTRGTRRAAGEACVYIAPPLPACGILSFGRMEEAYAIGRAAVGNAHAVHPGLAAVHGVGG